MGAENRLGRGIKENNRMKILCTCEHGNNRSVTMAHILKYVPGFETMTIGLSYHSEETKKMMFEWADKILVPERKLLALIPKEYESKVKFYDIGEDIYPRPFNKILYDKAKKIMEADKIL